MPAPPPWAHFCFSSSNRSKPEAAGVNAWLPKAPHKWQLQLIGRASTWHKSLRHVREAQIGHQFSHHESFHSFHPFSSCRHASTSAQMPPSPLRPHQQTHITHTHDHRWTHWIFSPSVRPSLATRCEQSLPSPGGRSQEARTSGECVTEFVCGVCVCVRARVCLCVSVMLCPCVAAALGAHPSCEFAPSKLMRDGCSQRVQAQVP